MTPLEQIEVGKCAAGVYAGDYVAAPEDVVFQVRDYLEKFGLRPVRAWCRLIGFGAYFYLIYPDGQLAELKSLVAQFIQNSDYFS